MLTDEQLRTFFTRTYCVSLGFRQDRWTRIATEVSPTWPLSPIQRFDAVDGQVCLPPKWWGAGRGAWGVYRSHTRILEVALNAKLPSVLILEDDALLVPNFRNRVAAFLEAVPADWGIIYLGGQHLHQEEHPPKQVNQQVYRAYNVNRCHAMAISAAAMPTVYQWLTRRDWKSHWQRNPKTQENFETQDHIDHHLGRLHMMGTIPVYTPAEWLIAQSEGQSNICGKDLEYRAWKGASSITSAKTIPTVVAVVGPFRSGTSCVAGMLHKLGVNMGRQFFNGRVESNPKGYFEARWLVKRCQQLCREPQMRLQGSQKNRVRSLREWAMSRRADGSLIGAKHPSLCLMLPAVQRAWPSVKIVAVTRDIDQAAQSLVRTGWWPRMGPEKKRAMLQHLRDTRDADLAKLNLPVLRLSFDEVRADPQAAVVKLVSFAGIAPTAEQVTAAIAHVEKSPIPGETAA